MGWGNLVLFLFCCKGGGSGVYAFAALYKISVFPSFGLGSIDKSFSTGCLPYQQNFNQDVLSTCSGWCHWCFCASIYREYSELWWRTVYWKMGVFADLRRIHDVGWIFDKNRALHHSGGVHGDYRNKCLKLMRGANGTLVDDEPMSYDINYPGHNLYSVLSNPNGGGQDHQNKILCIIRKEEPWGPAGEFLGTKPLSYNPNYPTTNISLLSNTGGDNVYAPDPSLSRAVCGLYNEPWNGTLEPHNEWKPVNRVNYARLSRVVIGVNVPCCSEFTEARLVITGNENTLRRTGR